MAQVWAVFLAVGSLAIGMLGVLGVWLCYLFQAVAFGPPPAPPPETPETVDDDDDKNGLSEAELRQLGGVVQAATPNGEEEEEEVLCPICLDAMEPGRAVRVLPGCNRAFHQDCVDRWLAISPRCPVCNIWATPQSPRASPTAAKTAPAPGC
ncbi:putative RING-H2 finger protein ATL71 [Triticum urartu]|uniref:RING-type domain-containing protein n=1 Tax=Triticum urartu TaxID=4572 RepID=A0A8R7UXL6_TRIUA|nr:putative RING-H2 finger protein ATL71 [Triticum urartu]